jgi:dethiobiotin synthetase
MSGLIVTGIHTGVGKTWVAAALTAELGWTYWKPIQTGAPTDTEFVQRMGLPTIPERYRLAMPAAPLIAAHAEGTQVDWEFLSLPPPQDNLVIEGAGGLWVPITPQHFLIDLFAAWELPVILVVRPYLGAMNHTWLSIETLKQRNMPFWGIILNATTGDPSEAYFLEHFPVLAVLPHAPKQERLPFLGIGSYEKLVERVVQLRSERGR